jgi:hypothetical protein
VQHRCGNHRYLDADRRERQDQSSIWFAQFDRKTVGMAHDAQRRPKDHGKKPDKDTDQRERMRGDFV